MTLRTLTREFGLKYHEAKAAERDMKKLQEQFFGLVTKEMEKRKRAQQIVTVPEIDPAEYVKRYHPGWRLVSVEDSKAVIEEDPALMKFTYVNKLDGYEYGRNTAQGSPSLDDERLRTENPMLWEAITEWPQPWYRMMCELADPASASELLHRENIPRVLKPLNTLDDKLIDQIQDYLVPGPVTVRLAPPKRIKDDK